MKGNTSTRLMAAGGGRKSHMTTLWQCNYEEVALKKHCINESIPAYTLYAVKGTIKLENWALKRGQVGMTHKVVTVDVEDTCLELAGRPLREVCQWGQEYTGAKCFHLCLEFHSVTKDSLFFNSDNLKELHTKSKIIKIDLLTNKPFLL